MFENGMKMLAEMAKSDNDHTYEDLTARMAGMKFSSILADMQQVTANDVKMTKEAVVVRDCKKLNGYLVEMGNITSYMQDNNVRNFKQAIDDIAECNNLDADKFNIVVSEQEIGDIFEDAKMAAERPDSNYSRAKLETAIAVEKVWGILEQQGIKLVKLV